MTVSDSLRASGSSALKSTIDPKSAAFTEAAEVMAAKLAELDAEHAK
ncbi:MAG: hypothetical protein QOI29_1568, partial [Mycobacterium sp.]|nr:hypothetical protein [Mycobacterium sp.]